MQCKRTINLFRFLENVAILIPKLENVIYMLHS